MTPSRSRPARRQLPSTPEARRHRQLTLRLGVATLVAGSMAVGVVGVGGGIAGAAKKAKVHKVKKHSGTVELLSAGSLTKLISTSLSAAFTASTGYTITDVHAGSTALVTDIKNGVNKADVFWSASPTADQKLQGTANGTWVKWYISFATSTLVLGYNPQSKFANTIVNNPWWMEVAKPGFLLGRTNPVTDPKGRLAVAALQTAATTFKKPTLAAIVTKATTIFTETSLVGRLQAGQLDAGFFYQVEASAAKLSTVPLTGVTEHATYTLTVVAKAPHEAAAEALVAWILSKTGKQVLAANGLTEITPVVFGDSTAVPKSLKKTLGS
jgi:molybdate/tungstate transport system substrate-binding protein